MQYLVHGVDLWLNNPIPPLEACGTSGMKASLNGVPNLSVIDGWWIEGYNVGTVGFSGQKTKKTEIVKTQTPYMTFWRMKWCPFISR